MPMIEITTKSSTRVKPDWRLGTRRFAIFFMFAWKTPPPAGTFGPPFGLPLAAPPGDRLCDVLRAVLAKQGEDGPSASGNQISKSGSTNPKSLPLPPGIGQQASQSCCQQRQRARFGNGGNGGGVDLDFIDSSGHAILVVCGRLGSSSTRQRRLGAMLKDVPASPAIAVTVPAVKLKTSPTAPVPITQLGM